MNSWLANDSMTYDLSISYEIAVYTLYSNKLVFSTILLQCNKLTVRCSIRNCSGKRKKQYNVSNVINAQVHLHSISTSPASLVTVTIYI